MPITLPNQRLIDTARLVLHEINTEHVAYLFEHYTHGEIQDYLQINVQQMAHYVCMYTGGMSTFRISQLHFVLHHKADNKFIGDCGFHTWNASHRRAEIFYNMYSDAYKQQGYMKEALGAVLHFGFTALNLHRIAGLIDPDNIASLKLLQHYGFVYEGRTREDYVVNGINTDSDCYSLLKPDWLAATEK
ncbi:MAG: hypothetical protein RL660_1400 [Bacteroidota bacterium]|jgi:ribosomal-protein-alanine N-acetyltransferase